MAQSSREVVHLVELPMLHSTSDPHVISQIGGPHSWWGRLQLLSTLKVKAVEFLYIVGPERTTTKLWFLGLLERLKISLCHFSPKAF